MKHNRMLLLFVMLLSVVALSGCMDVKNMTEEEADMVAEFSAGVLLRYSDTYQWRLITKEQREAGTTAGPTATPAPTEVPQEADGSSATQGAAEGQDEPAIQEVSLDEIYRLDGVNVLFKGAKSCRKYKNIQVPVHNKERLVVISFDLKNTTSKKKKVNLMKRDIEYLLDIDGETYQLGINLLQGYDMKYLSATIPPKKSIQAVLIYTVPKSAVKKGSKADVTIREGGSSKQASYSVTID